MFVFPIGIPPRVIRMSNSKGAEGTACREPTRYAGRESRGKARGSAPSDALRGYHRRGKSASKPGFLNLFAGRNDKAFDGEDVNWWRRRGGRATRPSR